MHLRGLTTLFNIPTASFNWARGKANVEKIAAVVNLLAAAIIAKEAIEAFAFCGWDDKTVHFITETGLTVSFHLVTGICQIIGSEGSSAFSTVLSTAGCFQIIARMSKQLVDTKDISYLGLNLANLAVVFYRTAATHPIPPNCPAC